MAYVGTPIDTQNQFQSLQGKRFNGDASTTAFTLDIAPNSVFDIEVFVENVRQDPNSAYTLNGTTLTFSAAPPSGTNNIYVIHQAKAVGTITAPVGGSIDMNGVELILDEDGDTSITADTDDQIDFKTGGSDRLKIDSTDVTVSTGNIVFGTASKGVYLGVTSATAANLLDDYEEGTFTPTAEFAASNPTAGATSGTGLYTKVGDVVTVWGTVENFNVTGASGDLRVRNLPFTSTSDASLGGYQGTAQLSTINYDDNGYVTAEVPDNLSYVRFAESRDAGARDFVNKENCSDGASDVYFCVTYKTG